MRMNLTVWLLSALATEVHFIAVHHEARLCKKVTENQYYLMAQLLRASLV